MTVTGSTKLTGIIGNPLEHSVSPQMHNAVYEKMGLDYCYVPIQVKPDSLSDALEGLRNIGFIGVNVTVPYKEAVIAHLDEVTKIARLIGAVNVILNQEGHLVGYNTDGPGFIDSLQEDASFNVKGKNVVVLGAGGAAKAITMMLAKNKVKTMVIADVIYEKAEKLCEYINSHCDIAPYAAPVKSQELKTFIEKCDLLVNSTPIGTYPRADRCPIDDSWKVNEKAVVYDLVYNPMETKLLKWAKASGAKAVSGIGMLVRQGALAFSLFTEEEASEKVMKEAALSALKSFKQSSK
jgi:shikimate dehydrogenase